MTLLSLILLLFAALFLIFTRTTYVYLKYDECFVLQFHFVIFSFGIKLRGEGGSMPLSIFPKTLRSLKRLAAHSEIRIIRLSFGSSDGARFENRFPLPYTAFALSSLFIAYFKANSKRIIIEENSIVLSPKGEGTSVDLRLYTELYNVIICLFSLGFNMLMHRKRRKRSYVGN